ncbi:hypothetical protein [Bdellovibrio svalbardensis]|uniref:Uncharacterized protein n=1 Tax=Bdellovibrio svalbardensis TaxID=2972972 RepID=A0ABT6DMT0_9BACT|nr:hypothetical protein [Bdellovibrio svalbardensis]MDG0817956.1 hypothetical protein [Bdellovibrio svalbardensis]
MKQMIKCISAVLLSQMLHSSCFAKSDFKLPDAVLNSFIPGEFRKDSNGAANTVGDGVRVSYVEVKFNRSFEKKFVVKYAISNGKCRMIVLSKDKKGYVAGGETLLNDPDQLQGCFKLTKYDLDQDGIDEVVVERIDNVAIMSPTILKWNGKQLQDVTPMDPTNPATSIFRNITIFEKPVQRRLIILDDDFANDQFSKSRIYRFENGKIELVGEYDLVSYLGNLNGSKVQNISGAFKEEGTYILTVKNVSDHNRSVRAEVVVNGSVVLKPQDFCKTLPPKKYVGRKDDDDNDDENEDHCRRCVPVSEAYAIVNMKTANEIKVKVFGRRDSKIQLSVVKK